MGAFAGLSTRLRSLERTTTNTAAPRAFMSSELGDAAMQLKLPLSSGRLDVVPACGGGFDKVHHGRREDDTRGPGIGGLRNDVRSPVVSGFPPGAILPRGR